MGFTYLLAFLAMISINLGIVNLIPIPGLDGGKLLLNLIQLIIRKPIPEDKEAIVDVIGFVILLLLIVIKPVVLILVFQPRLIFAPRLLSGFP